jgi:hypothetical protein
MGQTEEPSARFAIRLFNCRVASGCTTLQCPGGRLAVGWKRISALEMLTKWYYPTRLETRTKESNTYASSWV